MASAQTWTNLNPSGTPIGAYLSRGVYDIATNSMLVFGGEPTFNAQTNEVIALNLSGTPQWITITTAGARPAPRNLPTVAYDQTSSRMIVFSGALGSSAPCANDVWVLANANGVAGVPTWSQLSPSGAVPPPRWGSAGVYDPASNRLIVYGGNSCFNPFYGDTWVLEHANGLGGTPAWTQLSAAGTPPPIGGYHSAVYDPSSNRMIVFGLANLGGLTNDVWILNHANGLGGTPEWISPTLTGTLIPPTTGQGAAYDTASNSMIVFGGASSIGQTNSTWVLSNANGHGGTSAWSQLSIGGNLPAARQSFASAYDPLSKRLIVLGGGNSFTSDIFADTWALSLTPSNTAPTAVAGANQSVRLGLTVTLDGSGSFDDNTTSAALDYAWTFRSVPVGSTAAIAGADTSQPSFVPDVAGSYVIELVVTDEGGLASAPSSATIADNPPPTANAGADQLVMVADVVTLSGTGADPNLETLTYFWELTSVPAGSTAVISNTLIPNPTFVPNVPGTYLARLTISDPLGPGAPDTVEIGVVTAGTFVEIKTHEAAQIVGEPGFPMTNEGNRNAFINMLTRAGSAAASGNTAGAIHQLQLAIARTDGCALDGLPHDNGLSRDWITTCGAQEQVYPLLIEALAAITP